MKRVVFALFVAFVTITLVYLNTSKYQVHIGSNVVVTNHSKGEVLVKNLVGSIRGFGRDNLSGLSFYIIGDDFEMVAVKSDDGRMIGHMVSKYTAIALKKIIADGYKDMAYNIAKSDVGERIIYPLRFISFNEIEPKQYYIELPVSLLRDVSTSMSVRFDGGHRYEIVQKVHREYLESKK